jgi:hypothetical protein
VFSVTGLFGFGFGYGLSYPGDYRTLTCGFRVFQIFLSYHLNHYSRDSVWLIDTKFGFPHSRFPFSVVAVQRSRALSDTSLYSQPLVLLQLVPAPFAHQSTGNVNSNPYACFFSLCPLCPRTPPIFPAPHSILAPRYPRGIAPFHFDFSRVIRFAANAARSSRAGIRQADSSPVEAPMLVKPSKALASVPSASSAVLPKKPRLRTGNLHTRRGLSGNYLPRYRLVRFLNSLSLFFNL